MKKLYRSKGKDLPLLRQKRTIFPIVVKNLCGDIAVSRIVPETTLAHSSKMKRSEGNEKKNVDAHHAGR